MKSSTLSKFLTLPALALMLSACDFKQSNPVSLVDKPSIGDQGQGGQGGEPVDQEKPEIRPEDEVISFEFLKKSTFFSCKDCHTNTKRTVLRTHSEYIARLNDVVLAIDEERMPPIKKGYAPLTNCERALLNKWIELGAPNESEVKVYSLDECRPAGFVPPVIEPPIEPPPVIEPPVVEPPVEPPPVVEPPEPPPVIEPVQMVTYEYLLKTSLLSCADCHSKTKNEVKKPLLTTIEQYRGRIADVVMTVENNEMPITDFGAAALSACEKAMLKKWVDAGAPVESTIKVSEIEECRN